MRESPHPPSDPAEFLHPSFSRGFARLLHAFAQEGWKGASLAACMSVVAVCAGTHAERLSREVRACYERAFAEKSLPEAPGTVRHSAAFVYSVPVSACEETSSIARKDSSGRTYYDSRTNSVDPGAALAFGFLALGSGAAAGYGIGRVFLMRRYLQRRYEKAALVHPYRRDEKTRKWLERQNPRLGFGPADTDWLARLAPGTSIELADLKFTKGELDLWTLETDTQAAPAKSLNSKRMGKILARIPRTHRIILTRMEGGSLRTWELDYEGLLRLWSGRNEDKRAKL